MKSSKRPTNKSTKTPAFVARAERAFRRVARKVRAEHKKLGLPLVLGDKNRVRLVRVR